MIFLVVSAVVVVVLTFSSVPARRAANTGPQTQHIIISAIMPHENRPGFKTKECKVFILILFFLQQFFKFGQISPNLQIAIIFRPFSDFRVKTNGIPQI